MAHFQTQVSIKLPDRTLKGLAGVKLSGRGLASLQEEATI